MPTYRKGEDQFELEHAALLDSEQPVDAREGFRRSTVDKILDNPNIKVRAITDKDHPIQGPVGSSHLYERFAARSGKDGNPPMEIPVNINTHISGADIMRARKRAEGK